MTISPPDSNDSEVLNDWARTVEELAVSVGSLLTAKRGVHERPPVIYHYTDSAGLVGILSRRKLWASLATALNDSSETTYAMQRFADCIANGVARADYLPPETMANLLRPVTRPSIPGFRDVRVYVTSFCETEQAQHWLHYGRSGTGVAIGFDCDALDSVDQFGLSVVRYSDGADEQFKVLADLVQHAWEKFSPRMARIGRGDNFPISCASLLRSYSLLLAPRLKAPSFASEREWRLISGELWSTPDVPPGETTRTTEYRAVAGRVVPYKEIEFKEGLPIKEIVLGASSPLKVDEQALRVLMEDGIGKHVEVRRSAVPVRP